MKPKVNIIGVSGVIGSYLYGNLQPSCLINGTYFNHKTEADYIYLDITNHDMLMKVLPKFDDSIIILLSAIKDVKKCEENYNLAYQLNTQPVKSIAEIIEKEGYNIKLIYFSSDYVFEGTTKGGQYAPDSPLNPKTNYGRTKAEAENILKNSMIDYKIVRTAAVMGPRAPFFTWLVNAIINGENIELYDNVYFSPTPINFLCDIMLSIIKDYYSSLSIPSILHIVGEYRLSRFEFAQKIDSVLHGSGRLIPITKNLSNDIFQHDLSMTQSLYVKNMQNKSFDDYIKILLRSVL